MRKTGSKQLVLILFLTTLFCVKSGAQKDVFVNQHADTTNLSPEKKKEKELRPKVFHAEPLYVDLIRDLGARKGEKEWNIGIGLTDQYKYDKYTALVEYEWAPVDRLGLEVELPFTINMPNSGQTSREMVPGSRLNSLKLAGQWSFLVSEPAQATLAVGYIHEFELPAFRAYQKAPILQGHVFNPFFIAAKKWRGNFHTLIYTGPYIVNHQDKATHASWQINTNFHYMIPGTRNFIGIEYNKEVHRHDFDMTIRPQLRVSVADNLLVGIVTGIPIKREVERFSTFIRLIYEPKHKHS